MNQSGLMPREKLLKMGVESLTDCELLALLLETGNKEESVLAFSNRILKELDGLDNMLNMSVEDWCRIKGIKYAKASKLVGFIELARRVFNYHKDIVYLKNDLDVYEFVKYDYYGKKNEELIVVYVNVKCMLIKKMKLSIGSVNQTYVDIREVINNAIKCSATGIFLIHNHPSGDTTPSNGDILVTNKICDAALLFNIQLLDHIIVGNNTYYSFYKNKLI